MWGKPGLIDVQAMMGLLHFTSGETACQTEVMYVKGVIPGIVRGVGMDNTIGKVICTRITPSPLTKSISIFLFATWDVM